jgi:hypothetical protein
MRLKRVRAPFATMVLLAAAACGGDDGVEPDPALAAFVGTWDGVVYEIWPEANPSFVVDVLTEFGPFYITVEPSGQYTAVIEYPGAPPEIGQLSVIGSTIRLDPTTPASAPSATAAYVFTSEGSLTLDGATQIDFNDDGVRDPAGAHIELERR